MLKRREPAIANYYDPAEQYGRAIANAWEALEQQRRTNDLVVDLILLGCLGLAVLLDYLGSR